jgi:hypothetical protein
MMNDMSTEPPGADPRQAPPQRGDERGDGPLRYARAAQVRAEHPHRLADITRREATQMHDRAIDERDRAAASSESAAGANRIGSAEVTAHNGLDPALAPGCLNCGGVHQ